MKLHSIIRKIRQSQDLTQENLADEIGVTKDTIIRWEKDASVIQIGDLEKIASAFKMEVTDLLSYQDRENLVMEGVPYYGKKKSVQFMVELNGDPHTLDYWIKMMKQFNKSIAAAA